MIEMMAVTMATPADGPSLGVAPSGTCTWMSFFSNSDGGMPKSMAARAHVGVGGLDRFLHHVAQVAGDGHLALARHHDAFDGQDLAADLGPGQAR